MIDSVKLIRADNPGPMTLDGTNTWLIPDGSSWVVIDPGPLLTDHLDAIEAATDGSVSHILLTHSHPDHAEGAAALGERVHAAIHAIDVPPGMEPLRDEQVFAVDGGTLQVLTTPGHTADSATFLLRQESAAALFTGDTVLGRGTSVVIPPEGRLRDYLDSLERLEWIASELGHRGIPVALLPGHGPTHADSLPVMAYYIDHRHERLEQVAALMREGVTQPLELVERIYADVAPGVKGAALLSVMAQLEYLSERA